MHQIVTPGGVHQPVRASVRSSIETELRHLPSRDLEWLRRGLRRELAELPVGSPASRLGGRLCGSPAANCAAARTRTARWPPERKKSTNERQNRAESAARLAGSEVGSILWLSL
jgi:hypothetical protein